MNPPQCDVCSRCDSLQPQALAEIHQPPPAPPAPPPPLAHPAGNYNTYPRLVSLIAEFESSKTTIRPFWLSGAVAKLSASGLLAETDMWSLASEQLYVQCWKIDVEGQRHNSMLSGYEWSVHSIFFPFQILGSSPS